VTLIGIDVRPATDPRRTGIGVYADALVRHLPAADPDTRYVAWYLDVRKLGSRPRRFAPSPPNLRERATRIPTRLFGPVSTRVRLPKVEWFVGDVDLLLATNFVPPPTRHPERCVLVIHDMAWATMPWSAPHHHDRWRRLFSRALDACAGVIVPSAAVRGDVVATTDVDPTIVEVVHHGVDAEAFRPAPPWEVEDVRRRYGVDGSYVVFLGSLEPRKNLVNLIRAFGMLEHPVTLVLAGGKARWTPDHADSVDEAIASLPDPQRERVVLTGYVTGEDRRALLSGAEVLAYPSLQEGFGFPVLEAFAANVPVVTSTTSSLPEVAGDAALLVDPEDPDSIAGGLAQVLGDEDLRNVLRAAGTARVATFTWERCARDTAAVLHRALERAG
jgi:glycosyltransferase involved in cell wall biosynthesis